MNVNYENIFQIVISKLDNKFANIVRNDSSACIDKCEKETNSNIPIQRKHCKVKHFPSESMSKGKSLTVTSYELYLGSQATSKQHLYTLLFNIYNPFFFPISGKAFGLFLSD